MVDGQKIRLLREHTGLSTHEFALKVGASQAMISYIETGLKKPSVELLKRMADYFKCTMDDLLIKEQSVGA